MTFTLLAMVMATAGEKPRVVHKSRPRDQNCWHTGRAYSQLKALAVNRASHSADIRRMLA